MAITVKLGYVRHSARKLRPVLRIFAGQKLESAIERSSLMPQASSAILFKALKMAAAAATEKQFAVSDMIVSQLFATEGPKIKRNRPNARGRTNKYQKHLAHLTVVLIENKDKKVVDQPKVAPKGKIETKVISKSKK